MQYQANMICTDFALKWLLAVSPNIVCVITPKMRCFSNPMIKQIYLSANCRRNFTSVF